MSINKKLLLKKVTGLLLVLCFVFVAVFTVTPNTSAFADKDEDSDAVEYTGKSDDAIMSLNKDLFEGIFHKKITDGTSIFDLDGSEREGRYNLNYNILTGSQSDRASLYDRFGGNISFIYYSGETRIRTSTADKIYDALVYGSQEKLSFSDIGDLIGSNDTIYTNTFYQNRPGLKSKDSDPRLVAYKKITPVEQYVLGLANSQIRISEFVTDATGFFCSERFINQISSIIEGFLSSDEVKTVTDTIRQIMYIPLAVTLIFLVIKTIDYLRGKESLTKIFVHAFTALLSLGILGAALASPSMLVNITKNAMTLGDNLTAAAISQANSDNDIIHSDSTDNVLTASLWETSVFRPWVKATFCGIEYDNLYTTYSESGNQWELTTNQARAIGDISVPLSSADDAKIKNWAALAYSCSSIFHINATEDAVSDIEIDTEKSEDKYIWPKSTMAGRGTDYIYSDDFRWLDASLKVGQTDNDAAANVAQYINTREYSFDPIPYAYESLWKAILLIPILILGLKKSYTIVAALFNIVQLIFFSIMNMMNPEQTSIKTMFTKAFMPVAMSFWYAIVIFIATNLYTLMVQKEFFPYHLMYIAIAIYLCVLKPATLKSNLATVSRSVRGFSRQAGIFMNQLSIDRLTDSTDKLANNAPRNMKEAAARSRMKTEKLREDSDENNLEKANEEGSPVNYPGYNVLNKATAVINPEIYITPVKSSAYRSHYNKIAVNIRQCKLKIEVFNLINEARLSENSSLGYHSNNSPHKKENTANQDVRSDESKDTEEKNSNSGEGRRGSFTEQQELDKRILGIDRMQTCDATWATREVNPLYRENAGVVSDFESSRSDLFTAKRKNLSQRIKNAAESSNVSKRELKSLKRKYNSLNREEKVNKIFSSVDSAFGKKSVIPPMWKVKFVILLLVLYIGYTLGSGVTGT